MVSGPADEAAALLLGGLGSENATHTRYLALVVVAVALTARAKYHTWLIGLCREQAASSNDSNSKGALASARARALAMREQGHRTNARESNARTLLWVTN